jgi:acetolactate decarboxylase
MMEDKMAGNQKLPRDPFETGVRNGLTHHLIAVFALVIVVLVIAGGIILTETVKNPPKVLEKTPAGHDVLYQVSTIDALVMGVYDGVQSVGEVKKHGDFGIGIFEALDGEMIAADGRYYQVTADGTASEVDQSAMIPFASVTFFENDGTIIVRRSTNFSTFTNGIDNGLFSKNLIYAIRADATFPEVIVGAIPTQETPYPPLTLAATNQKVTRLEDTTGTIVGFYLPEFMNGVNIPGYHLHYISSDRKSGGHILDLTPPETPIVVTFDQTPDFFMSAPTTGDFTEMNFSGDVPADLRQAEH